MQRAWMLPLTANQLEALPPLVAEVLPDGPREQAEPRNCKQEQPLTKHVRRSHQRQRGAPHGRSSAAHKQRTLSDVQAIRKGAALGNHASGKSPPFWAEAGMRTAINRLCSVVLHAVGTGQLDLLHKCEAFADQLQAHFRIPPWQSALSTAPYGHPRAVP